MSKTDKRKIEALEREIDRLENTKDALSYSNLRLSNQIKDLEDQISHYKLKYAELLGIHIAMMERVVKLDEREAD